MGNRFVDRSAEISGRFATPECITDPLHIKPLPNHPLKPLRLSGNMDSYSLSLWEGWVDQKIVSVGRFCTIRDANNNLNIVLRGEGNKFWQASQNKNLLWHNWYTPNNLTQKQNTDVTGDFFAGRFGKDGQIVLIVHGADGHLWDYWSSPDTINSEPWTFNRLAMCTDSEFFALERHYGGLEAFAVGLDGNVWHSWTKDYDNDEWSQWESLGGCAAHGLYLSNNSEKYPELLICDPKGALWTIRHYKNGWHDWKCLGNSMIGRCCNIMNATGGMDIYGLGFDHKLYRISRETLEGEWGEWECLDGMFNSLVGVVTQANGKNTVCLIGVDHRLWRLEEDGNFSDLGGHLEYACLDTDSDGNAVVVGSCYNGNLFCRKV